MFGIPFVTFALIAINCIIFFRTQGNDRVIEKYGLTVADVLTRKDYKRLITAMFIHLNPLHLFMNMYALWSLGASFEYRYGIIKFIALYFILGTLTAITAIIARNVTGHTSAISVGASGVLYALFGMLLGGMIKTYGFSLMIGGTLYSLFPLLIMCFIPGMDNYVHISGVVVGLLSGFIL